MDVTVEASNARFVIKYSMDDARECVRVERSRNMFGTIKDEWKEPMVNWSSIGATSADKALEFASLIMQAVAVAYRWNNTSPRLYQMSGVVNGESVSYGFQAPNDEFVEILRAQMGEQGIEKLVIADA